MIAEAILDYLAQRDATAFEMVGALGLNPRSVEQALWRLRKDKRVRVAGYAPPGPHGGRLPIVFGIGDAPDAPRPPKALRTLNGLGMAYGQSPDPTVHRHFLLDENDERGTHTNVRMENATIRRALKARSIYHQLLRDKQ